MRQDFCPPQKVRQTRVREPAREHGCKELPRRQFQSRAYLFAEVAPQPSANKEQRLRIYESKNFRIGARNDDRHQSPVEKWRNSQGSLKRFERCAARALTPNVSVA